MLVLRPTLPMERLYRRLGRHSGSQIKSHHLNPKQTEKSVCFFVSKSEYKEEITLKTWKTRIMSALLVIMTLLTLLPTSALAASSTGTGIKPTSNTNYWTTRLLHDGTPYSYKPPMAAGKMLYCLDRGYGYRWGTASFLNSYTYTSATGADADTVLKTALAQSGMGELDAQQLENFKWMMTFIVDYKGDVPGSLFMAAQTYVWDHQTFKGEGDGDIDGGGYSAEIRDLGKCRRRSLKWAGR